MIKDHNTRVTEYLAQKKKLNNWTGLDFVEEFILLKICESDLRADFPAEYEEKFKII